MASASKPDNVSVIKPLGYQCNRSCGYCKKSTGSSSYYVSSSHMKIEHYQALVDRGWRRSGETYYKPDLSRSCCPHYTIRLEAEKFKASKSQRQAINRWNRFVLGSGYISKAARLAPRSREQKERDRNVFNLQAAVHASEYGGLKRPVGLKTGERIEPAHKFEINLESDSFSTEKHNVFLRYQTTIHKDPESRWTQASFKRFLCTGINQRIIRSKGVTQKLGSYHQCYRLDGRLIAVAVLDLTPGGVSSVYLFYDPEYENWELGKLSALREIALAREGRYGYYYMGYYIATCAKMRYKSSFWPTCVLDPESLEWNLLDDDLRRNIDIHHYFSLSGSARNSNIDTSVAATATTAEADPPASPNSKPEPDIDFTSLEVDPKTNPDPGDDTDDTSIPTGSLFHYVVPGVLTTAEIESKLNLNRWKLLVRKTLIDMEDLKGWEVSQMTDPQSLKGIVAELAAVLGPEVVETGSAVDLFG